MDLRLLVLFMSALIVVASGERFHDERTAQNKIKNGENVLIAYFGYEAVQKCSYMQDFLQQMRLADEKLEKIEQLKGKNLSIGLIEAPYEYEDKKHGSPIAVLYQAGYKPYLITHTSDGTRIANWVVRKLTLDPVYILKSQKEFDDFSLGFPLTFSAYFESDIELEAYRKVAYEFNHPFFLVKDGALANEMLGLDRPGIVADTHKFGKKRVYMKDHLTYDDYVRNWVHDQVHNRVGEIKHFEDAALAFTSETNYIAILFSSKSNPSHSDIVSKFWSVSFSRVKSNCLTVFYADIDDGKNAELMKHLEVKQRTGIVLISHPFNIRENPITKRCVQSNINLDNQKKSYFDNEFIDNYEIALRILSC